MQELAICTKSRRTATVKSKNYCVTAMLHKSDFDELVERFPDFYAKLRKHSRRYKDDRRKQLKEAIRRITYLRELPEETVEEMLYTLR